MYKLHKDNNLKVIGVIIDDNNHPRLSKGTIIPAAAGNRDWVEYLLWAKENKAEPADTIDYMNQMRVNRNQLLAQSDWTQLADIISGGRLTADEVMKWAAYRKKLCDMPQVNINVDTKEKYVNLIWPKV